MSVCNQMNTSLNLTFNNTDIKNACTSVILSKRYIKTLLRVAILNIMYRRIPIPEEEFKTKEFEKIPFVVFKRNSKNPIIRNYHGVANALVEAIDKNYLKDIHLMFKSTSSDDVLEYYRFTIKYAEGEKDVVDKFGQLKDETMYFFNVLRNLGKHPKLDGVVDEIEFSYYDSTPEDYEPPGFQPSNKRLCVKAGFDGNLTILGKLHTGYHSLACRAKGDIFNRTTESSVSYVVKSTPKKEKSQKSPSLVDKSEPKKADIVENITITSETSGGTIQVEANNNIIETPSKLEKKQKILDVSGFTIDDSEYGVTDISSECFSFKSVRVMHCLCRLTYNETIIDTAYCKPCSTHYHLPCLGFLDKFSLLTPSFQCKECNPDFYANDKCLKLDTGNLVTMARVRLSLAILYKEGSLISLFQIISEEERTSIYDRMVSWGILSQDDINENQPLNINRAKLEYIVSQMLKVNDSLVLN